MDVIVKYNKINDIQSTIMVDGVQVGWLEKPFRTWFRIEVFYHTFEIPANKAHLVTPLIKDYVKRIKTREVRILILKERMKNKKYKIRE